MQAKSIYVMAATEQTTEAFDLKLIDFMYKGSRVHWNFSHGISVICDIWSSINNNGCQAHQPHKNNTLFLNCVVG